MYLCHLQVYFTYGFLENMAPAKKALALHVILVIKATPSQVKLTKFQAKVAYTIGITQWYWQQYKTVLTNKRIVNILSVYAFSHRILCNPFNNFHQTVYVVKRFISIPVNHLRKQDSFHPQ